MADKSSQSKLAELQAQRDALIMAFPIKSTAAISNPPKADPESQNHTSKSNDNSCQPQIVPKNDPEAPAKPSPEQAALALDEAKKIVKQHIKLLHIYNEIRDIGQGLLGMIADQRGVRLVDVMEEFGVKGDD